MPIKENAIPDMIPDYKATHCVAKTTISTNLEPK